MIHHRLIKCTKIRSCVILQTWMCGNFDYCKYKYYLNTQTRQQNGFVQLCLQKTCLIIYPSFTCHTGGLEMPITSKMY